MTVNLFDSESIRPGIFSLLLKKHLEKFGFSTDQLDKFVRIGKLKTMKKGEELVLDGSDRILRLLLNGKLKLMDNSDPEEWVLIDILHGGDFFGDITLTGKKINNQFATAVANNTILCYFFVTDIRQMIQRDPCLALLFAASVGKKMRQIERRNLWFIRRKDVKARMTDFFQGWAEEEGIREGNRFLLNNDLTISDIAGYVSTSRQTVHTVLGDFKRSGFIEWSRKKIVVYEGLWEGVLKDA